MKKTIEFLYIFSKFSTSLILLIFLVAFGYFFYLSFNNQEKSNNDKLELLNKLKENAKNISEISKKISITETSLNDIKISINKEPHSDNSKEIMILNNKIESLSTKVESMIINLKKIQSLSLPPNSNINSNNNSKINLDKNKMELIKLILFKFENNLDYNQELAILQNINDQNKNHIFEKINLVKLKNFRGTDHLKNIFSEELNLFLKDHFSKNKKNIISKTIMRLVDIEPSKNNNIKNNDVSLLKELSKYIDMKNHKVFYKKVVTINNYEKYFNESINQIEIIIEFKELLNQVS